jgi:hypothetical protein
MSSRDGISRDWALLLEGPPVSRHLQSRQSPATCPAETSIKDATGTAGAPWSPAASSESPATRLAGHIPPLRTALGSGFGSSRARRAEGAACTEARVVGDHHET